jgi:cysteinyl-tRNA synthetase
MHHAFVEVEGEKMSKSLGNFTTLTDLLATVDRRAYRLLVLQAHYRSPIEVTRGTIDRSVATLARLDEFGRRTAALEGVADAGELQAAMDDDLDTPRLMRHLFNLVREGNAALDAGDPDRAGNAAATVRLVCTVVGLDFEAADDELDDATAALVAQRDAARAAKDWAAADAARDELGAAGWVVEDTPEGTKVRRA